ncbi:MAG TPA: fused MFS/spermidine synthase [Burkholderiales bacterium]|nr:fused MFS/spermidine synthase [Burkholderiales bacterium]
MMLYAIIFASGGAILALELLASRIMTPYFGVSLYIWTGILSITLVSLALGYWLGGRYTRLEAPSRSPQRFLRAYALMPAIASLTIVAACLVYPYAFAALATWNLLLGAFVACLVLLFAPLVATSAMNPLLVAILATGTAKTSADSGAGRVFFVSTVGSVAGVFATAFVLIPFVSNYAAVLVVACVLGLLSVGAAFFTSVAARSRPGVALAGAAGVLLAGVLMWQADNYTGRLGPIAYSGNTWRVEAAWGSLFGTVKILRSAPDTETGRFARMYFHDGLTQNTVESNGTSMSFYTYALEALARAYRPGSRHALVLGLGAGIVPMRLGAEGLAVDAVEINPVSLLAARQFFGFDPARVATHVVDARAFVRACPRRYEVAVVDLFHGDGTPEYLITRDFFSDLKRCLTPDGVAVFNTFADLERPETYAHFLVTLRSELPHLALYRPHWPLAVHINSFVVASAAALPTPAKVTFDYVPARHEATLWDMLAKPVPLTDGLFAGGKIMTDAHNAAAYDLAMSAVIYRRAVVENMPAAFLIN